MELYDFSYKIKNKTDIARRPLLSVAFSEAEDINKYSVLESTLRNFIYKDIHTITGLNLIEFLSLPYDIADMVMDLVTERQADKVKQIKQIQKDEEKLSKDLLVDK